MATRRHWGSRARAGARAGALIACVALLCALVTACETESPPTAAGSASPPTASASPDEPSPAAPGPAENTRPRGLDPEVMIAKAQTPDSWIRGQGRALLLYVVEGPRAWPSGYGWIAVALVDTAGRPLATWTSPEILEQPYGFWAAGRGFVGMGEGAPRYGPVFIHDAGTSALTVVRGSRRFREGDVRFGMGWLLDQDHDTITREELPGCRPGTARVDLRGRVWCLDREKRTVNWSDDGASWTRHPLSDSYLAFCDGGTTGADLLLVPDVVAIGLWRADVSTDQGQTWSDVPLPYELVGASPDGVVDASCTQVDVLGDGRLVLSYFANAVATDPTNTTFSMVRTPPRTTSLQVHEGVMVVKSRPIHNRRLVSYDGGATWQPLRVRPLVRHLFSP